MDKSDVMRGLEPFLARIHDCIVRGFHGARINNEHQLHIFTKRTLANARRDYIWNYIRSEFTGDEAARIHERKNGLCLLEIADTFIRLKKLNSHKCSSNIPTIQSNKFVYQQLLMFSPHPITNLNAGWIVNEAGTDIEIYITKPSGKRSNAWAVKILQDSRLQSIIEFPVPDTGGAKPWKPKTDLGRKTKGGEDEGSSDD